MSLVGAVPEGKAEAAAGRARQRQRMDLLRARGHSPPGTAEQRPSGSPEGHGDELRYGAANKAGIAPAAAANGLGASLPGWGGAGSGHRAAAAQPEPWASAAGRTVLQHSPLLSGATGPQEVSPKRRRPQQRAGWAGLGRTGQGCPAQPLAPPGGAVPQPSSGSGQRRRVSAGTMGRAGPWLNLSGSSCAAGGPFPAGTAAPLAALMGLLVLATVLGNALVILAFVVDRSLRTQGNFFFLNLAVADLLVGE